ncbi:uncharacterized protein LOC132204992 [Neocloeon triangulifer]|uniref:uncharacterized protein LOC132204992 n=1 Tax=Neocloeon triangulifer TaxID=2078957 RepID=UPI00286EB66B|nr:uncharacterized protein LOC132204992 [Neocloeon triangulifer]
MSDEFDQLPVGGGTMGKEVKKSSYYVWFLGAQEAKGLRGEEYIRPIVRSLVQKEREVEPFKVTLQVSIKGLKIVQNVPGCKDIVKHFIPHHAVTCVVQEPPPNDDIVSCILLIFNPATRCPVHVHCYRCDSVETAAILRDQLETLIERPDNQKKFGEIESRLQAKGLLSRRLPAGGSDGRSSSTRESESSGSSSERGGERVTNLYDSLAAELREKLHGVKGPLLLPPRDYDTVHRTRGNLTGIELRRCRNAAIVGDGVSPVSSGGSSGIGSDDAPPSPKEFRVNKVEQPVRRTHLRKSAPAGYPPEPHSSEEEDDWRESLREARNPPSWSPQRVATPATDLSLPRPRRVHQQQVEEPAIKPHRVPSFVDKDAPRRRSRDPELRQRSPSPLSPRERFQDAKDKFHRMEREKLDELQLRLERRRQETAAANVAAAVSSGRPSAAEARGQFRAVPVHHISDDEQDDDDDGFEPVIPVKEAEEQRRRTSHKLAEEFNNKRRSYHQGYQELADHERFPGLDRQTARLNHHFQERYRHSYAEPEYFSRQQGLRRFTPNGAPPLSNRLAGIHPY